MKHLISASIVCVSLSVAIAYSCAGRQSQSTARSAKEVESASEEEDRVKNELHKSGVRPQCIGLVYRILLDED